MAAAIALAGEAERGGEVPVGAVVVRLGEAVARAENRTMRLKDPTAHAEVLAIREAAAAIGSERLQGCTLYVTLEPCAMCAGAIVLGRVPRVVYAASDPKAGMVGSLGNLLQDPRLNHRCLVTPGVGEERSAALLKTFFRERRG